MVIVHIVLGKANPNRMNGVNMVVSQLATQQAIAGFDIQLWGITKNKEHDYPKRDFKTVLFSPLNSSFQVDAELKSSIKDLPKGATIHFHGGFILEFYFIAKYLQKLKIDYVITGHGAYNSVAMQKSKVKKYWYTLLFEKNILKNAKFVHCLGASEVSGVNSIIKNAKTLLIPYGFNFEQIDTKNHINATFTLGFCGRIDIHTKGLDLVLKALQNCKAQFDFKFIVIGGGNDEEKLKTLIKNYNLESNVVLLGSKFGEEKIELLSKLDVFIHPSRNEGLPATVIEAASLGIPLLISEETNVGTYVNKYQAGIVLSKNNETEIESAIIKMHADFMNNDLAKYSDNCIKMIKNEFSWDVVVQKFNQLYL